MPNEPSRSLPAAQALSLESLVAPAVGGVVSRVLAKTSGGNLTLFAFDEGQGLEEHTSPFDALVLLVEGEMELTIGGQAVRAVPGTVVRMPGGVPHALQALLTSRMLLLMLR